MFAGVSHCASVLLARDKIYFNSTTYPISFYETHHVKKFRWSFLAKRVHTPHTKHDKIFLCWVQCTLSYIFPIFLALLEESLGCITLHQSCCCLAKCVHNKREQRRREEASKHAERSEARASEAFLEKSRIFFGSLWLGYIQVKSKGFLQFPVELGASNSSDQLGAACVWYVLPKFCSLVCVQERGRSQSS